MAHPRYRGPVIDAHAHVDALHAEAIAAVDRANGIASTLNLWDLTWPPRPFAALSREWGAAAAPIVMLGCAPDLSRIGDPEFSGRIGASMAEAARLGARAFKIWKNLGLALRDDVGRLVAVDDPRLDAVWDAAATANLPVFIHVADPVAFFEPVDPSNERYAELRAHPEWSFCGPGLPSFDELLAQLRSVVRGHPTTTYVGVHMGCYAEDLGYVAAMLDESPNYFIDTSARIAEIGRRDPASVRDFFVTYADRILFGSDICLTSAVRSPEHAASPASSRDFFDLHWRFFETPERGLRHPFPLQGAWTVDGIDLPDDVLERLYHANALRLIGRADAPRTAADARG